MNDYNKKCYTLRQNYAILTKFEEDKSPCIKHQPANLQIPNV